MPRYNKSPNPSAANNLVGVHGDDISRITGLIGPPRSTGASVTMSTTAFGASVGGAVAGCAPGQTWTGVGWVRSSVARTIRVDLVRRKNGTFVSATDFVDTAMSANVWTQIRVIATLPAGDYNEVHWHCDLPTSGSTGTLSISSWRIEQVDDPALEYGDGDDTAAGWSWDGTPGNSTSTMSDTPPPPADVPPDAPDAPEAGIGTSGGAWSATPAYEIVAVARVPQLSGPPLLYTVDPIAWKGLAWTDEVSRAQRLDVSCPIATLPDSIIARLQKLREHPTELWLYRDSRIVCAGPLMGWLVQGDTLTLQATGLLGYTRYMFVTETLSWTASDQFTIAKGLVDHWQDLEYGDFGIDTSGVGTSGVTRDATYERDELHPIGKRLEELGERANGFDVEVDPGSRRLRLWYPRQGVNRAAGADAVIFDARNVTSPNVTASVAPGDLASEAFGAGTGATADEQIWATAENVQVRATFGRAGVAETFDGVSEQSTLDAHTQELLDARDDALLIPGPDARSTADSDLAGYGIGDTVAYQLHERLGVSGSFRIRKRTVSVDETGIENIALEFE